MEATLTIFPPGPLHLRTKTTTETVTQELVYPLEVILVLVSPIRVHPGTITVAVVKGSRAMSTVRLWEQDTNVILRLHLLHHSDTLRIPTLLTTTTTLLVWRLTCTLNIILLIMVLLKGTLLMEVSLYLLLMTHEVTECMANLLLTS